MVRECGQYQLSFPQQIVLALSLSLSFSFFTMPISLFLNIFFLIFGTIIGHYVSLISRVSIAIFQSFILV